MFPQRESEWRADFWPYWVAVCLPDCWSEFPSYWFTDGASFWVSDLWTICFPEWCTQWHSYK